jgi:hypothetical protein
MTEYTHETLTALAADILRGWRHRRIVTGNLVRAHADAWKARLEVLEGFWRDMVQVFGFDGSMNLDGGDFEELAEKHGLIKWVTYNPEDFTEAEREHIEVEPGDQMWVSVDPATQANVEPLEGSGLEAAALLAGKLYRIIKSDDNLGIGHMALRFKEKDGRTGAVIVLAPDDGNVEILDAVDAIYQRQDNDAASEPSGEGQDVNANWSQVRVEPPGIGVGKEPHDD